MKRAWTTRKLPPARFGKKFLPRTKRDGNLKIKNIKCYCRRFHTMQEKPASHSWRVNEIVSIIIIWGSENDRLIFLSCSFKVVNAYQITDQGNETTWIFFTDSSKDE